MNCLVQVSCRFALDISKSLYIVLPGEGFQSIFGVI